MATPGEHHPIMVAEVLEALRPAPGERAIDATLGAGGHAEALLQRLGPHGHLIGIDVDAAALAHTEARLRAAGFGPDTFTTRHGSFAHLPEVLASTQVRAVDVLLVDLGISAMQADDSRRGFHYKIPGPLDMRMNQATGDTAADLVARLDDASLQTLLTANADEPHADVIAALLVRERPTTTQALERTVRLGLAAARPDLTKPLLKASVRRTFQALRIAVNDEFAALDALLAHLPQILAPGGRVAIITFHSGEDRRVKQAFRAGLRSGHYSAIARSVIRSAVIETRANRRAMSAKLRWAVRA